MAVVTRVDEVLKVCRAVCRRFDGALKRKNLFALPKKERASRFHVVRPAIVRPIACFGQRDKLFVAGLTDGDGGVRQWGDVQAAPLPTRER